MSTDPRWTDETEKLIVESSNAHIAIQASGSSWRCACGEIFEVPERASIDGLNALRLHQFRASLAALADAGVLLPPGGETRTEWSTEPALTPRYVTGPIESDREIVCPMREPEQAMRDYMRGMRQRPALVSRTVYTGPWQPVGGEDR